MGTHPRRFRGWQGRHAWRFVECAVYLHVTLPEIAELPIRVVSSPAWHSAIREVLWGKVGEDPETLLNRVPGLPRSPESCTEHMMGFLLDDYPGVFSWIPIAYRQRAEMALGLQLDE